MNPTQNKIKDLEKKREKIEKDLENAKKKLEQQKQNVSKKENELKRMDAELVSTLLVENGLTMSDLTSMLLTSEKNENETVFPTDPNELGGM